MLHANPQLPAAHVARPFIGTVHARSQAPQCCTSVCASTQLIAHRVLAIPLHPLTHAYCPPASWQSGDGSMHRVPHRPQLPGEPRSASHPLPGFPSQSAKPALQVKPQVPIAHVGVAFAGVAHARAHIPQCATVVRVSTSHPLLASPSQSANPVLHVNPHAPIAQVAVAFARAGHASHRAPQVATDVSSAQAIPHA